MKLIPLIILLTALGCQHPIYKSDGEFYAEYILQGEFNTKLLPTPNTFSRASYSFIINPSFYNKWCVEIDFMGIEHENEFLSETYEVKYRYFEYGENEEIINEFNIILGPLTGRSLATFIFESDIFSLKEKRHNPFNQLQLYMDGTFFEYSVKLENEEKIHFDKYASSSEPLSEFIKNLISIDKRIKKLCQQDAVADPTIGGKL